MALLRNQAIFRGLAAAAKIDGKWTTERAGRQPFDQHQFDFFLEIFTDMADALSEADLPLSADYARKIVDALREVQVEPSGKRVAFGRSKSLLEEYISRLVTTLPDEAGIRLFVSVAPQYANEYLTENAFGMDVSTAFPSLDYEVGEAAKCLALSRSTASAFHSIRCLEAGIRAISRGLGIPDPTKGSERSWHKTLAAVREAIDQKWPSRLSGDGAILDKWHAQLVALANPYRNATMHLDGKYTIDEAVHIFWMVKGLMSSIAGRLNEDGEPKFH